MLHQSTHDLGELEELRPRLLQRVFDASQDCIKIINADGRLLEMNKNGQCLMEIDDFSKLKGQLWASLWPQEATMFVQSSVTSAIAGASSSFNAFCPTAKGTPRWWDVKVIPLIADSGISHIVSISRDVTDRVLREKEQTQHAQEIEALQRQLEESRAARV